MARHVDSTGRGAGDPGGYSLADDGSASTPSTTGEAFTTLTEGLLAEELVRKAGHRLRVPKMMRR